MKLIQYTFLLILKKSQTLRLKKILVIQRPPDLAKDNSPEWLSWKHAVEFILEKEGNFDIFLSLPTTAPLRVKEDVQKCLRALNPMLI